MKNRLAYLAAAVLSAAAFGQVATNPPFINSEATAYDQQIATAFNGIGLMAKRAPSNNKYVNIGPQGVNVAGGNPMPLVIPAGGSYVGNSDSAGAGLGSTAPAGPSVLDQRGMTLISPLGP